jgi:predicted phosphodiesterase
VAWPILIGFALALAAVGLAGPSSREIGPFQVEMATRLVPRGETTLAFPPFGQVSAATHRWVPVEVRFTLTGVDLGALREWVGETSSAGAAWTVAVASLRPLAGVLLVRVLALAVLLGGAGAYLLSRDRRSAIAGALAATLAVAGLALGLAAGYDRGAFARPHYEGALEAAPWVVGLLEKNWDRVGDLGGDLEVLAQNLSRLSEGLSGLSTVGSPPRDLRLLHVSDLHNNPAGVRFIAEAVRAFEVDAVVDTGDLTDWGTPLEADLVRGIAGLGVPYFFVPGNHDSPALLRELRRYRSVRRIDERPAVFRGLTLFGAADPSSDRNNPEPASAAEIAERARALEQRIAGLASPPDVVAVHNQRLGLALAGQVRVVLHGHDHRLAVHKESGTIFINAGTTGAAGLRGLEARREVPFSMVLLYFSQTPEGYRLRAVDTLEVRGRSAGFSLNRILVGDEGDPSAAGEASTSEPGVRPAATGR